MHSIITDDQTKILLHFYNKLKNDAKNEKIKLINGSLFLTILKIPNNKISKLLISATLPEGVFYNHELSELLKDGYICETENLDNNLGYIITAMGLWAIENNLQLIDHEKFLNFIQEDKFPSINSDYSVNDIQKIILTSMIAIRNFSLGTPMDLNEETFRNNWVNIFDQTAEFLKALNYINNKAWSSRNTGAEHPINYVMRRAQSLPQKTRHLYKPEGNYKYYLNIINKPSQNLKFLFSIIFPSITSQNELDEIYSFLCKIAYDKSKLVRDNFEFINPEWDTLIQESLDEFYYAI